MRCGSAQRGRGRDAVAAEYYGFDPYASRSSLDKTVVGAAWEADWDGGRLRTTLGVKGYHYRAIGWSIHNLEYRPAEPQSCTRAGALAARATDVTESRSDDESERPWSRDIRLARGLLGRSVVGYPA